MTNSTTIHASLQAEFLTDNTIEGWLCKYGVLSNPFQTSNGKEMYWSVVPGAFKNSVDQINSGIVNILCNVEHETDDCMKQIGSTATNITLEHRIEGIYFKMTLPDTTVAQDLYRNMKLGLVNGVSLEAKSTTGAKPKIERTNQGNYIKYLDDLILTGYAIVQRPRFDSCKAYAFSLEIDSKEKETVDSDIKQFETEASKDLLLQKQEFEAKIATLETEKTELQLQIEAGKLDLLKEKIGNYQLSEEDKAQAKEDMIKKADK